MFKNSNTNKRYYTLDYYYKQRYNRKVFKVSLNLNLTCPNCDGTIIEKHTKKGKICYGCNNFPKCKFASWDKPLIEKCPECGGVLVEKKDKIKCLSCDYEK